MASKETALILEDLKRAIERLEGAVLKREDLERIMSVSGHLRLMAQARLDPSEPKAGL